MDSKISLEDVLTIHIGPQLPQSASAHDAPQQLLHCASAPSLLAVTRHSQVGDGITERSSTGDPHIRFESPRQVNELHTVSSSPDFPSRPDSSSRLETNGSFIIVKNREAATSGRSITEGLVQTQVMPDSLSTLHGVSHPDVILAREAKPIDPVLFTVRTAGDEMGLGLFAAKKKQSCQLQVNPRTGQLLLIYSRENRQRFPLSKVSVREAFTARNALHITASRHAGGPTLHKRVIFENQIDRKRFVELLDICQKDEKNMIQTLPGARRKVTLSSPMSSDATGLDDILLLGGEVIIAKIERTTSLVCMSNGERAIQGLLLITNYRLKFLPYNRSQTQTSSSGLGLGAFDLPLGAVAQMERDGMQCVFTCSDVRSVRLTFHDARVVEASVGIFREMQEVQEHDARELYHLRHWHKRGGNSTPNSPRRTLSPSDHLAATLRRHSTPEKRYATSDQSSRGQAFDTDSISNVRLLNFSVAGNGVGKSAAGRPGESKQLENEFLEAASEGADEDKPLFIPRTLSDPCLVGLGSTPDFPPAGAVDDQVIAMRRTNNIPLPSSFLANRNSAETRANMEMERLRRHTEDDLSDFQEEHPLTSEALAANQRWAALFFEKLRELIFPGPDPSRLFAFAYKPPPIDPEHSGWFVYNPVEEFVRLGLISTIDSTSRIAETELRLLKNAKFRLSPTYPQWLVVPQILHNERDLIDACAFRSRGRIPVVSWRHPVHKCVLVRSSQPLVGMSGRECAADQKIVKMYRQAAVKLANGQYPPIYIIDARKPLATQGNKMIGKGVEDPKLYDAVVEYLHIANIHKMRESINAMSDLLEPKVSSADGGKAFLTRLQATKWLKHLSKILAGSIRIALLMQEAASSILVHCSDGWDRTPQLVATAQLLLDPFYRTIRGFAVLVEKEWCSFGHKFSDRIGVGRKPDDKDKERSPVMLQWLDVVYQIMRQYPMAFEFDDRLLLHVADALTSGLYGTFLCNTEKERIEHRIWERTVSVWTPVLLSASSFYNPRYVPIQEPIWPRANEKKIVLWESVFFRYDLENNPVSSSQPVVYLEKISSPSRLTVSVDNEEESGRRTPDSSSLLTGGAGLAITPTNSTSTQSSLVKSDRHQHSSSRLSPSVGGHPLAGQTQGAASPQQGRRPSRLNSGEVDVERSSQPLESPNGIAAIPAVGQNLAASISSSLPPRPPSTRSNNPASTLSQLGSVVANAFSGGVRRRHNSVSSGGVNGAASSLASSLAPSFLRRNSTTAGDDLSSFKTSTTSSEAAIMLASMTTTERRERLMEDVISRTGSIVMDIDEVHSLGPFINPSISEEEVPEADELIHDELERAGSSQRVGSMASSPLPGIQRTNTGTSVTSDEISNISRARAFSAVPTGAKGKVDYDAAVSLFAATKSLRKVRNCIHSSLDRARRREQAAQVLTELKQMPMQSQVKYLQELLSEAHAREIKLEEALDSAAEQLFPPKPTGRELSSLERIKDALIPDVYGGSHNSTGSGISTPIWGPYGAVLHPHGTSPENNRAASGGGNTPPQAGSAASTPQQTPNSTNGNQGEKQKNDGLSSSFSLDQTRLPPPPTLISSHSLNGVLPSQFFVTKARSATAVEDLEFIVAPPHRSSLGRRRRLLSEPERLETILDEPSG